MTPSVPVSTGNVTIGLRVVRGPDWKWNDQDGGAGKLGTITRVDAPGQVRVQWDSGESSTCRVGGPGMQDLAIAAPAVSAEANAFAELLVRNKAFLQNVIALSERTGAPITKRTMDAMEIVPREFFCPEKQATCLNDAPTVLESYEFNVSAPHIHATAFELLDAQPGQRALDVGCGCGIVSAMLAVRVGRTGKVLGVDILPKAVELSRRNEVALRRLSQIYRELAGPVEFRESNVFRLPEGSKYHRIHVGAMCPGDLEGRLLDMLLPGGVMLSPVDDELRVITKSEHGIVTRRVVYRVLFMELRRP